MIRLKTSIALSLDHFIAYKGGELNWIPENVSSCIMKEFNSADTILMGANTYQYIVEHHGIWPFNEKKTYVVSHYDTNTTSNSNVVFLTENPMNIIQGLRETSTKDLFVVGGGQFITTLINNGLLDEITVYLAPILLGDGIPFIGKTFGSKYTFSECKSDNDIIKFTCIPK
jgi:dihydrofolate reductase